MQEAFARATLPAKTGGATEGGSSVGVDQRTEHFIGGLGDFHAQLRLDLAHGHLDHIAGQVRLLAAVDGSQALDLDFGRLAGDRTFDGRAGDLAGGLIDTVLPGLHGTQAGVESGIPGNFHGRTRPCKE
ncbi:hypothetical protein EMIT0P201_20695 [Pseudomonas chlororaphis]